MSARNKLVLLAGWSAFEIRREEPYFHNMYLLEYGTILRYDMVQYLLIIYHRLYLVLYRLIIN